MVAGVAAPSQAWQCSPGLLTVPSRGQSHLAEESGTSWSHSNPLASPHFHTLLQVSTLRYQTFIKDPYYSQSIFCSAKIFFSFGTSWSHSKPLSSLSVYSSERRLIAAAHCSTAALQPAILCLHSFLPDLQKYLQGFINNPIYS